MWRKGLDVTAASSSGSGADSGASPERANNSASRADHSASVTRPDIAASSDDAKACDVARRLASAVEQAVASAQTVVSGDRILVGDFTGSKIVGYTVGEREWTELLEAAREVCDAAA